MKNEKRIKDNCDNLEVKLSFIYVQKEIVYQVMTCDRFGVSVNNSGYIYVYILNMCKNK